MIFFFFLLVIVYSLNKICRDVSYTNYHSSFVYQSMLFISQCHSWPYHCLKDNNMTRDPKVLNCRLSLLS